MTIDGAGDRDGTDQQKLARALIETHGNEAPAVAPSNAGTAALASQPESWIRVLSTSSASRRVKQGKFRYRASAWRYSTETRTAVFNMAKNTSTKFVRPDADLRQAEAAKTSRLRLLRLAKEAEDAEKATAAKLEAAAAKPRPRVRASQRPTPPVPTT